MASIHVRLVIYRHGSMSNFRDSSLKILTSPLSPFSINMIGIDEISDAIFRQAVNTSGLSASEVYPLQTRSVSLSETTIPIHDEVLVDPSLCCCSSLFLFLLLLIDYLPHHSFAFSLRSIFSSN